MIEGGDDALCHPSTHTVSAGGGDRDAPSELPMERINKVSSGGIFGTDAFLLNLPHRCRALAIADTLVWSIARPDLARMEIAHPKVFRLIPSLVTCPTSTSFSSHPLPFSRAHALVHVHTYTLSHTHTYSHTHTRTHIPPPRCAS